MALAAEQYRDAMLALLPNGPAWPSHPDTDLGKLFLALGREFGRIEKRAEEMLAEFTPWGASEMLSEWLSDWDVPGKDINETLTATQLKQLLIAKVTTPGTQSRDYFIKYAAAFGYDITPITEYTSTQRGTEIGFTNEAWNFIWQIVGPPTPVARATFGVTKFGEPFQAWGNTELEKLLKPRVHTHRKLLIRQGS